MRTPVPTAPLIQLSPDAGSTIIQHEAVTVYNSVNEKVKDVIDFLHEALLAYTKGGLKWLKQRYHELILDGDFNIQFDTDEGLRYVQFLKKELNLDFVSVTTKPIVTVINNDVTIDEINNVQDDFNIEEKQLSL
ncbi:hypothetical protein PV325_011587 [Microctonus aethiopoides]|nr:hypothetical protein PV325_011587 [Microctonus aethiopoides]